MRDPHDLISRRYFRITSHLYLTEGFCGAGSSHGSALAGEAQVFPVAVEVRLPEWGS